MQEILRNLLPKKRLKRYTRLIYGISNAGQISQDAFEKKLGKITSVTFICDDIIVHSNDKKKV